MYKLTGDDYAFRLNSIVIPAGQTHVELDISIMDDNTVESNESFAIEIIPQFFPNKVSPANPNRTTIIIVDNDG